MPKLEPKIIQRELEQGLLWPVYWLYGAERMKSRELLKRIRRTVLGDEPSGGGALLGFAEENLDGSEVTGPQVVEAAQSPSLGGGTRFIVVRDAHALKESEQLATLLQPRAKKDALASVCVFLSKDLDGRKKFSKLLLEKAAVVPCEDVPETEREAWIGYLAKRRNLELPAAMIAQLMSLDPWSLDIIDQELEKWSLARDTSGVEQAGEVILTGSAIEGGTDAFLEAFFTKDLKQALAIAETFADQPDESLPLLGLLGWNVRQLAVICADREAGIRPGTHGTKLNPYAAEKLQRWSRGWRLSEVLALQSELAALDFSFKQTPLLPLGLWSSLVMGFATHHK